MKKMNKRLTVADGHVLGDKTFAAITAVEGMSLSPTSRKRLADMSRRNLSQDDQRKEVIRAYVSLKSRR